MIQNFILLVTAVVMLSVVQLIIKHRFNVSHGEVPLKPDGFIEFVWQVLKDPYLWLAGIMLVSAAILWYAMVSRMSLGVAFTFAALSYPLVMAGSYYFLGENFAFPQILGCGLIVTGLCMISAYS